MTSNEFEKRKELSKEIVSLLKKENMATLGDLRIIWGILRGYPFCLDTDGHYTYNGQYYDSLVDLPAEALQQLLRN